MRALAGSGPGLSAVESAVIASRRDLVAKLHRLVLEPSCTETDVQNRIGSSYWLFGGRYVGVAERRNLTVLDQHDIPLLGADGTLHIVELKGPNIAQLVRRHRNHYIVGNPVHEAAAQAMNYLRALDEQGPTLSTTYRNELGIDLDLRRLFATVVIGHPGHVRLQERCVDQAIRSYNSHLSRVEVITYKDLLDSAQRALAFEQSSSEDGG